MKRQGWAYDAAGNRTVDQNDDAVYATSHDSLNRLQSRAPGGPIKMTGTLSEAATVTIDGKPATVDGSNDFQGTAQIAFGTTTVTVKAKDYSGNETTQQYEIDASGSTTSYTYDANGNLTSDGTKTFLWNALNQLVEVKEGTTTVATFAYDGAGRRTEKVAAGVTHAYVYDAEDIVEERLSGSTTDTIRYYHGAGIDEPLARKNSSDVVTYYLADHLGSIVQETSSAGTVILDREYDPWGKLLQGAGVSGSAFTGREWDSEVGLYYYRARYYSPSLGRFIGDDPIGFQGGTNFAAYASASPTGLIDPSGLAAGDWWDIRANLNRSREIAAEEFAKHDTRNDIGDAIRHSEWMRRTAEETNWLTAWLAGTGHELDDLVHDEDGFEVQARERLLRTVERSREPVRERPCEPANKCQFPTGIHPPD